MVPNREENSIMATKSKQILVKNPEECLENLEVLKQWLFSRLHIDEETSHFVSANKIRSLLHNNIKEAPDGQGRPNHYWFDFPSNVMRSVEGLDSHRCQGSTILYGICLIALGIEVKFISMFSGTVPEYTHAALELKLPTGFVASDVWYNCNFYFDGHYQTYFALHSSGAFWADYGGYPCKRVLTDHPVDYSVQLTTIIRHSKDMTKYEREYRPRRSYIKVPINPVYFTLYKIQDEKRLSRSTLHSDPIQNPTRSFGTKSSS